MVMTAHFSVLIQTRDFRAFADRWPCSGMRFTEDICACVDFAPNGDLTDICWHNCSAVNSVVRPFDIDEPEGIDGGALLAIIADAHTYLTNYVAENGWFGERPTHCDRCGETVWKDQTCACNPHPKDVEAGLI